MRSRTALAIIGLAMLTALVAAAPAFAYDELTGPLSGTRACYQCHGLLEGETTQTATPGQPRTGPHGGYTAATSKCATCHTVHAAPADGMLLLPAATVEGTCFTCHDGTGGKGVYGVVAARTNLTADQISGHSIGMTNQIPGGDPGGGAATGVFSSADGTLTCSDCHSVHAADTVDPFVGDRYRDSRNLTVSGAGLEQVASDRLLKRQPMDGVAPVDVYGGDWCATCHLGRAAMAGNHPTYSGADYYYGNVSGIVDYDSTEAANVALGGENLGYVMPESETRPAPICQQCHEDARSVGPASYEETLTVTLAQQFTVTSPDGLQVTDNPQFQTFPHESDGANLLLEPSDALCLNCHTTSQGSGAHTNP